MQLVGYYQMVEVTWNGTENCPQIWLGVALTHVATDRGACEVSELCLCVGLCTPTGLRSAGYRLPCSPSVSLGQHWYISKEIVLHANCSLI